MSAERRNPIAHAPELASFLEAHPWPAERAAGRRTVDFLFIWEFGVAAERLWPYLTDTSRLNEMIGLPAMSLEEREGRLFGSYRVGFARLAWEEVPWQWEAGREYSMERIYSTGPLVYLRGSGSVEALGESRCRVTLYLGYVPRNRLAALALQVLRRVMARRFTAAFESIVTDLRAGQTPAFTLDQGFLMGLGAGTRPRRHIDSARIDQIEADLRTEGLPSAPLAALVNHVRGADDRDLYRIRPLILARQKGVTPRELTSVMLHATARGMLVMTWDIVCPHCLGVRERHRHLWEVRREARCEACGIDFDAASLNTIEVSFYPDPALRSSEKVLFCSAEPAQRPHIWIQRRLGPGEAGDAELARSDGRYRLRVHGSLGYNLLDIDPDREGGQVLWGSDDENVRFESGGRPRIRMENRGGAPTVFVVEEHGIDREALRPGDLFGLQEFRDLFAGESLPFDLSIDVGAQNIVFVDVVGSTALYGTVGNTRAFTLVRQFFRAGHEIALKRQGAIVKTLGDALMLAFPHPLDALKAAADFTSRLDGTLPDMPLLTRVTVNRGSCLAVNLNSGIDYFGQPVNVAAKLQRYAGAGEIIFTDEFAAEPAVRHFLEGRGFVFDEPLVAEVPGAGTQRYWVLKARTRRRGSAANE